MKTKAHLAAIAATCLITGSTTAFAASSVDLTITGKITPSACMPSLSQNGIVDYGRISAKDLEHDTMTQLPPVTLQMSVNCEAKTLFALMPRDHRLLQGYNGGAFSLAWISEGKPLGLYFLDTPTPPVADGVAVTRLYSEDNGVTWRWYTDDSSWRPELLTAFGDRSTGVLAPLPIKDLSISIKLSTLIWPAKMLPISEEIPIDGSATFEVRYL